MEFGFSKKRGESSLDKLDTLFGRVYLVRLLLVQGYKPVPYMPLVFFEPRFHFVHLVLGYHALIVEHARILLQVFERGAFTRPLAFRRDIVVHVLFARHIEERPLVRVLLAFVFGRSFRTFVRRVLYIEYYRLIAYCSLPPQFLNAFDFVVVQIIGRVGKQAAVKVALNGKPFALQHFRIEQRR